MLLFTIQGIESPTSPVWQTRTRLIGYYEKVGGIRCELAIGDGWGIGVCRDAITAVRTAVSINVYFARGSGNSPAFSASVRWSGSQFCSEWWQNGAPEEFRTPKLAVSGYTSGSGRVSRASPVQTATRNCTRDEGGPFGFGNQVLISSHRKLLWSKAMVVSVAETPGRDSGRHGRERRAQANRR